jgi:outer membrane protein
VCASTRTCWTPRPQLTNTQKDLYKARYDVIIGAIKLRQAAGTLTAADLTELNKLVAP